MILIYAYFNNGSMLDIHLSEWEKYENKEKWRAIIVDDCSNEDPAEKHIRDVGFPIELYRIDTDIPWNQNGARNLAMHTISNVNDWCLMTDMDHLLKTEHAEQLMNYKFRENNVYKPARMRAVDGLPYKRHPNTYVLQPSMYWNAGGYDERFCGYYGTDSSFRRQLMNKINGFIEIDIPLYLYGREVVPDASTTQYGRKGSEYHLSSNPEIRALRKNPLPPIAPLNFEWHKVMEIKNDGHQQ